LQIVSDAPDKDCDKYVSLMPTYYAAIRLDVLNSNAALSSS